MEDVYDVVIVGGSFAGLATAFFIEDADVLILEKEPALGQRQRSACAAPLSWIEEFGCGNSIFQRFDTITFHSSRGSKSVIDLPIPFSTIDYTSFCNTLARNMEGTEVVTGTRVRGVSMGHPKKVDCGATTYKGRIVVDASGWRAVTAKSLGRPDYIKWDHLAAGIEVLGEADIEGSLHVYYGKKFIPGGYAWIFPIGEGKVRVGVGSFKKADQRKYLKSFIKMMGIDAVDQRLHGGMIPCNGLREPVLGDVFFVGDAGGHAFPFTAEGIRPAFENARTLGGLISKVLKEEMGISKAVDEYRKSVYSRQRMYSNLFLIQRLLFAAPDGAWHWFIKEANSNPGMFQRPPRMYFNGDMNLSASRLLKGFFRYLGGGL